MEPSSFLMLAGLLVVAFLLSGSVSFSIGLVLIYNNYLWWSNGFQYDGLHVLVNAVAIITLVIYITLSGWVSRKEERKLRELNIPEII
jgi:uncharacterized BrkB/YihY/UPF0761 family membrane protein